jgi:hypothetical protein
MSTPVDAARINQGIPGRSVGPNARRSSGESRLQPTVSRAEAMAYLGIKHSKLHDLMVLGRKFRGCHPLKGGLWPWFPATHKNVRIEVRAIEQHRDHMMRLLDDGVFAAQMRAAAAKLGDEQSRSAVYFAKRKAAA